MAKFSAISWEIIRKAVHLSGLLTVVVYTVVQYYFSERVAILVLTGALLLFLQIEYVRIEHRASLGGRLKEFVDGIFRKHEEDAIAGSIFYVISCIICFAAFDYWIAVLAMFMTAFGDIFASIMGRLFGRTKIYKGKTIVGTFAGFGANLIVGLIVLREYPYLVLLMAFVASLVEMLTNKLDDNLTVPLFAGFVGQMMVYYYDLWLPEMDLSFLPVF